MPEAASSRFRQVLALASPPRAWAAAQPLAQALEPEVSERPLWPDRARARSLWAKEQPAAKASASPPDLYSAPSALVPWEHRASSHTERGCFPAAAPDMVRS